MKQTVQIGLITLAFATAVIAPVFAADPMTESLKSTKGSEFDKAFISHMIEHHKSGVQMAELASTRGQNAAVKQIAQKIVSMQQKEIQELHSMSGGPSAGMAHPGHAGKRGQATDSSHTTGSDHQQMMQESLAKLESASGTEFDRLFVAEMQKHHQNGLEIAELAKERATRSDVRAFADKVAKQQRQDSKELSAIKL